MSIDTIRPETADATRPDEIRSQSAPGGDFPPDERDAEYYRQYKSLSALSVASVVFGALSMFSGFDWTFLLAPALGLVFGIVALRKVRARPDELTGAGLARTGIGLSLVFGAISAGYLTYYQLTKVPSWATEISYEQLQPDPDRPSQLFPPEVQSLNGKKLYIEGYVFPGKEMGNIREFILCRDKGTCCFGGNPKLTDRIAVRLTNGLAIDYSQKLFAVAGQFYVRPSEAKELSGGVIYHLDAEFVR